MSVKLLSLLFSIRFTLWNIPSNLTWLHNRDYEFESRLHSLPYFFKYDRLNNVFCTFSLFNSAIKEIFE
jgi:hypothetical protein